MALPMVHLSVAHGLVCSWGNQPAPAFYLGSIAPDAIHMRPGTGPEDKRAAHLFRDLSQVERLVTQCWQRSGDAAFAEGYAVHLLTDDYWAKEFVRPLRARLEDSMPRHEFKTLYYAEGDKIDLELYDRQPWRGCVWALLKSAEACDFEGLLSGQEIELWRDRVLHWFDENQDKKAHLSCYLTQDMVLGFISDATVRIGEQMALWRRSIADMH